MSSPRVDFLREFKKTLRETYEKGPRGNVKNPDRQMQTCFYGLEESFSKYSPITAKNSDDFKADFFQKINQYVENQHEQGKKVYWINGAMALAAKKTFEILEKTSLVATAEQNNAQFFASASSAPSSLPQAQMSKQLPLAPASLSDNDLSEFKKDDYSFDEAKLSQEQMSILDFASNCCAYPKLALYLAAKHNIDPRTGSMLINRYCEAHPNVALSPGEILTFQKEMKNHSDPSRLGS